MDRAKRLARWILVPLLGGSAVFGAPLVPVQDTWTSAYSTYQFDTLDGDLDFNEYAIDAKGNILIRTVPKDVGGLEFAKISTSSDPTVGKTQVGIVCTNCASYANFKDFNGNNVRVPLIKTDYDQLGTKNPINPTRTEMISVFASFMNPPQAKAAIARDSSQDVQTSGAGVASFTYSYTVGAGSSYLMTAVYTFGGDSVTGVTYSGTAMTQLVKSGTPGGSNETYLYGLGSPATGANNVVISVSPNDQIQGWNISYTGSQTTSAADITGSQTLASSAATSITVTFTTTAENDWSFCFVRNDANVLTSSTNYTALNASAQSYGDSNGSLGAAGSVSMTAGITTTGFNTSMICAAIKEATSATSPSNKKSPFIIF